MRFEGSAVSQAVRAALPLRSDRGRGRGRGGGLGRGVGLGLGRVPLRSALAVRAGRVAATLSRRLGLGHGAVVGGRVALFIDPQVLRRLTAGRAVTVVTGTNGKTTTTLLIARALATQRTVSATRGANMTAGLVSAAARQADEVVLEVDELYIPRTLETTEPTVLVLLNLTRDQLDRIVELRRVAKLWRDAIAAVRWPMTIVANADDPMVVWAVGAHPDVVWAAVGSRWRHDAMLCPSCEQARPLSGDGVWACACGFTRPEVSWTFDDDEVSGPGIVVPVQLALPGEMNRGNAAVALAVASSRGVELREAAAAVAGVQSVDGRYLQVDVDGRRVRLLLAKNPASWTETLVLLAGTEVPVVICVNARGADGLDTSWLWDVGFELLAGRTVVASGERRLDVAVRLETAHVSCSIVADSLGAVSSVAPIGGRVDVVGTYTAFHDILDRLKLRW